jgi:putative YphP/YqiW family bacilliredoxin
VKACLHPLVAQSTTGDALMCKTMPSNYPPEMTEPMRDAVRRAGLSEVVTAEAVDEAVRQPGTTLVFVNSVCGCAGGTARPALAQALAQRRPGRAISVFAGVDHEATAQARGYFGATPPSSPSMALIKDGQPVWTLSRHEIQGRSVEVVTQAIVDALAQHG